MLRRLKGLLRAAALGVRRDAATGHLYYRIDGVRVYLRFPEECIRRAHRRLAEEAVYFRHYRPSGRDCVVDIGAGLGTEIVALAREAPELRYVAVEIQPWVYECLCLTMAQLPPGYRPFGLAIAEAGPVSIAPTQKGIDSSTVDGGPVPVETVTWGAFAERHGIERVDLLKMNVEGAEAELLEHVDLGAVERVIVGVHDFRAERGEGERFRTRERVEARLRGAGFSLIPVEPSWIFASR